MGGQPGVKNKFFTVLINCKFGGHDLSGFGDFFLFFLPNHGL